LLHERYKEGDLATESHRAAVSLRRLGSEVQPTVLGREVDDLSSFAALLIAAFQMLEVAFQFLDLPRREEKMRIVLEVREMLPLALGVCRYRAKTAGQ